MLLYQASAGDAVTSMVLNELRKYAPALEYLQFFKGNGSGASERYGDDIDGTLDTRSIGEDFDSQEVSPLYGAFALKILGKNVKIDTAYEEQGGDVPSEFQIKLKNWAMNAGRDMMYYLIDGNSATNSKQFNGLRKIIALLTASGVSDRVISPAGGNGLAIPLGNDNTARKAQQQFLELLDNLIESVDGGANCLMMDGLLKNRLSAVAKEMTSVSLNQYDEEVVRYKGVPIVPTSRKHNGTRIIPWTETVGTSTDCTSVFAFNSQEKANLTAMTTRTGLKVYPMEKVGNFYQHMVQLQMDIAPLSNRCVSKLEGIRLG